MATYWTAQDIPAGWTVDSGYTTEAAAHACAARLPPIYEARVALLETREHDEPFGEDGSEVGVAVQYGRRWCVLVKGAPGAR